MLLRLASSPIPETAPAPPIVGAHARRRAPDAVSTAQRTLLVLILLTAAGLRWWRIGAASLWTDELLSLEVSSGVAWRYVDPPRNVVLEPGRELTQLRADGGWRQLVWSLRNSGHPPLYFATLRLWRELLGTDDDAALRSLSAVCSLLAILFAFDAVRLMHGTRAALWAAALLAVNGLQIQYAQETRGYAMFVAEMMAACAMMARIERYGAVESVRKRATSYSLARYTGRGLG